MMRCARMVRAPEGVPRDGTAYVFAAVRNAAIDRVRVKARGEGKVPVAALWIRGIRRWRTSGSGVAAGGGWLPEEMRTVMSGCGF